MVDTLDPSKIASLSETPGIGTVAGSPLTFQTTFSGTIPIGSSLSTTLPLTFARTDVMSLTRVNIAGGHVGALWFPVTGFAGVLDALVVSPISSAYYMLFTITASGTGRTLNIEFINETVGATVALPTLTITAVVHLYDYPF
jgi:hypothetical protein